MVRNNNKHKWFWLGKNSLTVPPFDNENIFYDPDKPEHVVMLVCNCCEASGSVDWRSWNEDHHGHALDGELILESPVTILKDGYTDECAMDLPIY